MTERSTLAWLIWCFSEGYVTPYDREIMTNWLEEPLVSMNPADVELRENLLAMADQVLAAHTAISSERHALYVGCVLGLGMKHGLPLRPVVDEAGNYTNEIELAIPEDGITVRLIVPPPPKDWNLNDWIGGT